MYERMALIQLNMYVKPITHIFSFKHTRMLIAIHQVLKNEHVTTHEVFKH